MEWNSFSSSQTFILATNLIIGVLQICLSSLYIGTIYSNGGNNMPTKEVLSMVETIINNPSTEIRIDPFTTELMFRYKLIPIDEHKTQLHRHYTLSDLIKYVTKHIEAE